jgi:hypothetical protein
LTICIWSRIVTEVSVTDAFPSRARTVAPRRAPKLSLVPADLDGGRLSNRGSGRLDPRSDPGTQCLRRELSAEYHAWALEVLRAFPFDGATERYAWLLHCEGHGAHTIDRMLAPLRGRGRRWPRDMRALYIIRRLKSEAEAWMAARNELPYDPYAISALEAECDPAFVAQLHDLRAKHGPDVETMRAHLHEYPELAELLDHE